MFLLPRSHFWVCIGCDRGSNFFLYPLTWAFAELVQNVI
uniref:Respiratory burst NADPH oxidase n=1 Tax=Siphoviridae sp. ctj7g1 TaxID=2826438 RepID=A0A8S5R1F8_9CAUD|nr:MAG TPA: Respiratory burst NADPH oxidase [Siphoviridae sp. ctj7g1]